MTNTREEIARLFHDTYEAFAPAYGYETREDTKEFDPESKNGKLMMAVCEMVGNEIYSNGITEGIKQSNSGRIMYERGRKDANNTPMGVSQWREHGKKYGYDSYFIEQGRDEERKEITEKIQEYIDDKRKTDLYVHIIPIQVIDGIVNYRSALTSNNKEELPK